MSDEDSVPARPNDLEDNPGNVGDAAAGMSFTREQTDRLLVVLVNAHKNTQRILSNMEQLMRQQGAGNTESMSPATTTASMPINLGTTAGVKAYLHGTQISDKYKNMTLESSNKETFKTLTGSLDSMGYSTLINVPTDGSGLPDANPKRLSSGKEVANIDLKDYFHLVKRFANVSKEHVENWSAFIHGDVNDGLQTVDPRIEKYLDLKAKGNDGLVAQLKHQLRIRCNMLRDVLEQALTTAAYDSLLSNRASFEWEKEEDGTKFFCGVTLLWHVLQCFEPTTILEAHDLLDTLENTTLAEKNNCIRSFFSTMSVAFTEIRSRFGVDKYSVSRYVQRILDELKTCGCAEMLSKVSKEKQEWVGKGDAFDYTKSFADIEGYFNFLVKSGEYKLTAVPDSDQQKVIALATENKKLKSQVKDLKKQAKGDNTPNGGTPDKFLDGKGNEVAGPVGTAGHTVQKWRTQKQGDIKIVDGRRHQWCPNHVAEGAHGFRGLYMFCNSDDGQTHDHSKWLARKQKKKEKKESDGASEATTPATTPSAKKKSTASGGSPTKKRKTVVVNATNLVTTYGMSHANAEQLINDLENSGAGGEDADF